MTETKSHLPIFEFIILCSIVFMGICNISVFYSFHVYLQELGFTKSISGMVISLYSLSSMVMYAAVSSAITVRNAYRLMFGGMALMILCGIGYLELTSLWALSMLRVMQGVGTFLALAPCMTLLVSMISPDNAGSAFSLYSTALLLPYSIMPLLSERLAPYISNVTWLYAGSAGLIPIAFVLTFFLKFRLNNRAASCAPEAKKKSSRESYVNLKNLKILNIMAANGVYFTIFTGLFFMFQDFSFTRGIEKAGFFFSIQMGVMIAIRLFGGKIFDRFSKRIIIFTAFIVTSVGFMLLINLYDDSMLVPVAIVFGVGMGLSAPALNSLMFTVSEPEYRNFNANMMMLTVHMGSFLGPLMGGGMVDILGYRGFLQVAVAGTLGTAFIFMVLSQKSCDVRD